MFSPSPCPGYYSWHLATMASADSCFLTIQITPYGAASSVFCLLIFVSYFTDKADHSIVCAGTLYRWPLPVFSLETKSCRMEKQVSPDKSVNFRCLIRAIYRISCSLDFDMLCCLIRRLGLI